MPKAAGLTASGLLFACLKSKVYGAVWVPRAACSARG